MFGKDMLGKFVSGRYKLPLFIIVIILVIGFAALLLSANISKVKQPAATPTTIAQPVSPTEIPLDLQSADSKLSQTDSVIQDSLNQVDADTLSFDQIDMAADNSTGL